MPKYPEISQLLRSRIRRGDYKARPFPSSAKLAVELEVNWRTASRALEALVKDGLLVKTTTGRITPAVNPRRDRLHLALVAPAYATPTITGRYATLERLAAARGWDIRMVGYCHVNDPVIHEAIEGFDALFLVPLFEDLPPEVLTKLRTSTTKIVSLFADLTQYGIPSLQFENHGTMRKLLDHLYGLGHRSIACLNTQPQGRIIGDRIDQWRLWKQLRKVSGPLINQPVELNHDPLPQARAVMSRCIAQGLLKDVDAVFCTTNVAAIGMMRALADHNLIAGRDIGVCAADQNSLAEYLTPSLTSPIDASNEPYLEMCLDWFASDQPQWSGPLLVQSMEGEVFAGESTMARKVSTTQQAPTAGA